MTPDHARDYADVMLLSLFVATLCVLHVASLILEARCERDCGACRRAARRLRGAP